MQYTNRWAQFCAPHYTPASGHSVHHSGMETDPKEKLWIIISPHPPPNSSYPDVNFMGMKSTFSSSPPPTGTTSATTWWRFPHTSRLQTTDRHRNHQPTQAHTPLLSHLNQRLGPATYAVKIETATSQNRMPQCVPGFSSSQTFTSSSTGLLSWSGHHTEEYVTIWGCASVYLLINLFLKITHINKRRWNVPVAFHVFDQLDQPCYRLPITTPIYWQSRSPQTFFAMVYT